MFARRGIFVGVLIGAATLVGGGAAMAAPLPLESPAPAPAEPVAGGLCNLDPAIALWCLIASPSA
ncbi:hypothetical protein [Nocardia aurantiaca]|uniref:Uncharacterized protein n=1 Tax=Nocardia aurantiaca TaxID=2675850 RepID=A0A6I3L0W9_9NOCA|nr:hypothetical protein [Nocardia aurantiaca]MTE15401.1 hypothetical protein [Nocardia aurantiaca]